LKEKNVKTMKFFFAMACVLGLAASCFAQNADINVPTKKTSGIHAARAAALRALKAHDQSSEEAPPTTSPTTGTLVFTITIDLHPGFPSNAKLYCSASADTSEYTAPPDVSFSADGYAQATISGTTATCSITLKYGWLLATPKTDTLGLGVDVSVVFGTEGIAPYWVNQSVWSNSVSGVPASGSTTPVKVTTAI
jgi:hypothetical protein